MSTGYNKTTWQDGDIITADKMNNIENGIKSVEDTTGELKENLTDLQEVSDTKASVIYETVSGSIASFTDGADDLPMKSAVVSIEPIQDLHGYDNPWPAGGGKNLLDWDKITVGGTHYGMTFSKGQNEGTVTVTGTFTVGEGAVAPIAYADNSLSGKGYVFLTEHISGDSVIDLSRTYGFRTENERAIAIFLNGTAGQSYTETIRISVYAPPAPTSWTPYSNICPISGRTGVKVARTGKNLSSYSEYPYIIPLWGASIAELEAVINALPVGTYTISNKYRIESTPTNNIVQHGGFYVTAMINGTQKPVNTYNVATDNSLSVGKVYTESKPLVITEENQGKINHCYYYCDSSVHTGNGRGTYKLYEIMIELGSTATAYTPYSGDTYTIQLGQTAYGGKIDATQGKMVVDRAMVDLGTLTDSGDTGWKYITNDGMPYFCVYLTGKKPGLNMLCSAYGTSQATGTGLLADKKIGASAIDTRVYLKDFAYTDLNTFISAMSGVQLCYELATQITVDLTPIEISVLTGQTNNIWADSGDVSVDYAADLKTYIDNKIAAAVAALS